MGEGIAWEKEDVGKEEELYVLETSRSYIASLSYDRRSGDLCLLGFDKGLDIWIWYYPSSQEIIVNVAPSNANLNKIRKAINVRIGLPDEYRETLFEVFDRIERGEYQELTRSEEAEFDRRRHDLEEFLERRKRRLFGDGALSDGLDTLAFPDELDD